MSLKKYKIEKELNLLNFLKYKYQFRIIIFYALLMALISSKGIDSTYEILKYIYIILMFIVTIFMMYNLTKMLDVVKAIDELKKEILK